MASPGYYPFPSEVNVANFVPLKLGAPSDYFVWKQLMLNLIESHELDGFVDGTIQPPPVPLEKQEEYRSWKRSDGLVRAWLFVTVTEEILRHLVPLATAREAWIALEEMLTPSAPSLRQSISESEPERTYEERAGIASEYSAILYRAILNGEWETTVRIFEQEPDAPRAAITSKSETALMVAIRSSERNYIVRWLIEKMSPEDLLQQDIEGETALHKAAKSRNNEAVMILVWRNQELPNRSVNGRFPAHFAAIHGNREMVFLLLEVTNLSPFNGEVGVDLLACLAYGGLYDIASVFLQRYPMLARPYLLQLVVHRHSLFCSGTHLNFFASLIYSYIPLTLEGNATLDSDARGDIEAPMEGVCSRSGYGSRRLKATFWNVAEKLVPPMKFVRVTKMIHYHAPMFVKLLCAELARSHISMEDDLLLAVLKNAESLGTGQIVEEIVAAFPWLIGKTNEKEQNIFHVAIKNRRENVFNLIYQLGENQRYHFMLKLDMSGNSPLHMAGNLGDKQQLSLRASVACSALQMQRELQWFKAVEKLVPPKDKYTRNREQKTPQELFTETHKDLVKEGEKWMKSTASSCTIVAALIVTVVFAAAIIVPGGNKGDSGLPVFLEDQVFVLFGVSDALALFSSTTSLLTFLSILTSRYGEQDFLYSLPGKLIIGLVTLFLSIISMMVAFAATLKIVFGHERAWIAISGVVLSCVPVTLFAFLQFPLLLRMIKSTYYPGMFKKRSNRILLY